MNNLNSEIILTLGVVLTFLAGLIWGVVIANLYIKFKVRRGKIPKFLEDLGLGVGDEESTTSPVIENKSDKQ